MTPRRYESTLPNINVKRLGFFLDGWADIIEGKGSKANLVRRDVLAQLEARGMPDINSGNRKGFANTVASEYRDYVSTETYPGVVTLIYISQHGKDLYASWRTYIRPVANTAVLFALGAISLFFGIMVVANSYNGSGGAFFGGWIVSFIILALMVAFAGYIVRRDPIAFFLVDPSYFDIDDITAMDLSVHYSVLRALDKAGITTAKLRLKRDFKTGRKGDIV